uniref:SFRICE_037301 n=1 Tax=Spodoptera frugiperda TaxID=7108 RepID=A0A2H1W6X8_SPOFR
MATLTTCNGKSNGVLLVDLLGSPMMQRLLRHIPKETCVFHEPHWANCMAAQCILDVDDATPDVSPTSPTKPESSMLSEFFPSPFMNGYYVDNVERDYRIVVWE